MTKKPPAAVSEYLAQIGRKGGQATSQKKAAASRENGKRGGAKKKAKELA